MVAAALQKKKKGTKNKCPKPHFFKVLIGDFAHHLRIPEKFTRYLEEERRCDAATLVGPGGGKWEVEYERTSEGGRFAGGGWRRFAEEHSLRELEFLVFQYDGSMRFTVFVFDTSACERGDLLFPATKRPPPPSAAEGDQIAKIRIKEEEEEEDDDDEITQSCVVCLPRKRSRRRKGGRRRVISREERMKAERAANSFTSPLPFCIKRMYSMNVQSKYTLRFPGNFSQTHLPRRRAELILKDPNGKPWTVNYIPSSMNRDRLSVGWSEFARGNNLEEGDFCVFELVAPEEMQVHIVRVIEEEAAAPVHVVGMLKM